jgi:hypothetical protein
MTKRPRSRLVADEQLPVISEDWVRARVDGLRRRLAEADRGKVVAVAACRREHDLRRQALRNQYEVQLAQMEEEATRELAQVGASFDREARDLHVQLQRQQQLLKDMVDLWGGEIEDLVEYASAPAPVTVPASTPTLSDSDFATSWPTGDEPLPDFDYAWTPGPEAPMPPVMDL